MIEILCRRPKKIRFGLQQQRCDMDEFCKLFQAYLVNGGFEDFLFPVWQMAKEFFHETQMNMLLEHLLYLINFEPTKVVNFDVVYFSLLSKATLRPSPPKSSVLLPPLVLVESLSLRHSSLFKKDAVFCHDC